MDAATEKIYLQQHECWLEETRRSLRIELREIRRDVRRGASTGLDVDKALLILLTLEPTHFEYLRRKLQALPSGTIVELFLSLDSWHTDRYCRNPPDEEALLATATQLAHMVNSIEPLKSLVIYSTPAPFAVEFLAACSQLESLEIQSFKPRPVMTATVQSIFSIKTLRKLEIHGFEFPDAESVDAFRHGLETSALEKMYLNEDCYCAALSKNVHTKLERLSVQGAYMDGTEFGLSLQGGFDFDMGEDAAIAEAIQNLLNLNVQRKFCPPLFAAIGDAGTDSERKQCLVEALEAVDIPVVFEYISANENNIIALIQRLGRSRKRRRED